MHLQCNKKKLLVAEIFIAATVFAVPFLIDLTASPYNRGFFIDDNSIKFPYKDSTVSTAVLLTYFPLGAIVMVFITEAIRIKHKLQRQTNVLRYGLREFYMELYSVFILLLFGAGLTHLATNILKYSMGSLRPHFLSVCKPDWSLVNVTSGQYIAEDICTSIDKDLIQEARLSFPSGHSSISFYLGVFLSMYLQRRLRWPQLVLVRPVLQLALLSLASLVAVSRVSDYKHHGSDVLAGGVLGAVIAVYTFYFINNHFTRPANDVSETAGDETECELDSFSELSNRDADDRSNKSTQYSIDGSSNPKLKSDTCVSITASDGSTCDENTWPTPNHVPAQQVNDMATPSSLVVKSQTSMPGPVTSSTTPAATPSAQSTLLIQHERRHSQLSQRS